MTSKRSIQLALISSISRYGDLVAVISIPIFLFEKTKDLFIATIFTVLACLASIVSGKISSMLLKSLSSVMLVFYADTIAAMGFLLLGLQARYFTFDQYTFLLSCSVIAVFVNIPMFTKGYLIHYYFVKKEEVIRFSLLQGRMQSLALVAAILSCAIIMDKFGFFGVMIFNCLTYLPLLVICLYAEKRGPIEKTINVTAPDYPSFYRTLKKVLSSGSARYYLIINLLNYFLTTFRSHILLVSFISIYPQQTAQSVSMYVGSGILITLIFIKYLNRLNHYLLKYAMYNIGFVLFLISLVLYINIHEALTIFIAAILLNELSAFTLAYQREIQDDYTKKLSPSELSYVSTVIGAAVTALLIPVSTKLIELVGMHWVFLIVGTISVISLAAVGKGISP